MRCLDELSNQGEELERTNILPESGTQTPAGFPVTLSAIDVGSNAIRFCVAEFREPRKFRLRFDDRVPVRLGHGVFVSGRMRDEAMDAAVSAFIGFKRAMEVHGVKHYRAVATSAVRESSNGAEFVERIRKESGIELKIIDGTEEARLVYLAVRGRLSFGPRNWLLAELGGGSVEVSLADDKAIVATECHSMGSVRLLDALAGSDEEPGRFRTLLRRHLSKLKIPAMADPTDLAGFVATGGNIEALSKLAGMPVDDKGVSIVPLARLKAIAESLFSLSYRERIQRLGLREDRADVVLPAAMVYIRIAEMIGVDEVIVPHTGIKEGVLFDLVDEVSGRNSLPAAREREITDNCVALGRKFFFIEGHAMHVAKLSLRLFDQLRAVHGLGEADRELLLASTILHDIGGFISIDRHHKHSMYLILSTGIKGFDSRSVNLIANIARYHRKAEPSLRHASFARLPEADRNRVTKLSAILRLADGLDPDHRHRVYDLRATVREGAIHLALEGSAELPLVRTAVRKKSKLFCRVFGARLSVSGISYEREDYGTR